MPHRRRRVAGRDRSGALLSTVSLSSPTLTPNTTNPWLRNSLLQFRDDRAARRLQGPHQEVQKSSKTTFPLVGGAPLNAGAGLPSTSGLVMPGRVQSAVCVAPGGGVKTKSESGRSALSDSADGGGDLRHDDGLGKSADQQARGKAVLKRQAEGFRDPTGLDGVEDGQVLGGDLDGVVTGFDYPAVYCWSSISMVFSLVISTDLRDCAISGRFFSTPFSPRAVSGSLVAARLMYFFCCSR